MLTIHSTSLRPFKWSSGVTFTYKGLGGDHYRRPDLDNDMIRTLSMRKLLAIQATIMSYRHQTLSQELRPFQLNLKGTSQVGIMLIWCLGAKRSRRSLVYRLSVMYHVPLYVEATYTAISLGRQKMMTSEDRMLDQYIIIPAVFRLESSRRVPRLW